MKKICKVFAIVQIMILSLAFISCGLKNLGMTAVSSYSIWSKINEHTVDVKIKDYSGYDDDFESFLGTYYAEQDWDCLSSGNISCLKLDKDGISSDFLNYDSNMYNGLEIYVDYSAENKTYYFNDEGKGVQVNNFVITDLKTTGIKYYQIEASSNWGILSGKKILKYLGIQAVTDFTIKSTQDIGEKGSKIYLKKDTEVIFKDVPIYCAMKNAGSFGKYTLFQASFSKRGLCIDKTSISPDPDIKKEFGGDIQVRTSYENGLMFSNMYNPASMFGLTNDNNVSLFANQNIVYTNNSYTVSQESKIDFSRSCLDVSNRSAINIEFANLNKSDYYFGIYSEDEDLICEGESIDNSCYTFNNINVSNYERIYIVITLLDPTEGVNRITVSRFDYTGVEIINGTVCLQSLARITDSSIYTEKISYNDIDFDSECGMGILLSTYYYYPDDCGDSCDVLTQKIVFERINDEFVAELNILNTNYGIIKAKFENSNLVFEFIHNGKLLDYSGDTYSVYFNHVYKYN